MKAPPKAFWGGLVIGCLGMGIVNWSVGRGSTAATSGVQRSVPVSSHNAVHADVRSWSKQFPGNVSLSAQVRIRPPQLESARFDSTNMSATLKLVSFLESEAWTDCLSNRAYWMNGARVTSSGVLPTSATLVGPFSPRPPTPGDTSDMDRCVQEMQNRALDTFDFRK
jgi:hypothetical protein